MGIGDKTVRQLAQETAAPTPTPGGGSIAAVCGALAASLAGMVASLALGKEEYKDSQAELRDICDKAQGLQDSLLAIADQDSAAYDEVAAALKMPKATPEEKVRRRDALQLALKKAAEVPLETMEKCRDVIALSKLAIEKGSRSAFTDAGSAALIAHAGLKAAALNARINLASIKDEAFCARENARMESLLHEAANLATESEKSMADRF